ncbi:MAG: hypothetical protein JOZ01_00120 [Candidatus Eremiobacteraeota bacterium]|nr:hypothetical protein [Candidatus Eremiobacteraeota bacterium]
MTFAVLLAVVVIVAGVEIVFPGRGLYHAGWFNVALAATTVAAVATARRYIVRASSTRARASTLAVTLAAAIAGIAVCVNGLLAPDNRTIVGAPGERVRFDDLGATLVFPAADVAGNNATLAGEVVLLRPHRSSLRIGDRHRLVGTFALKTIPRDVAYVDVRDVHGGRLTITQPSGTSFLSPVLLLQQRQKIAGFDVPFDSFAVPAAHRLVKAVFFTAAQADMMRGLESGAGPAILFAVDDENDRPLPNAIGAVRSGATIGIDRLRLRAAVFSYPAVEVASVPAPVAVITAALLVIAGMALRYIPASAERT